MIDLCRYMVDGKYTEFYAAFAMGGTHLILVGLKDTPQLTVTEWRDKFDAPDIDDLGDAGYVRLRSAGTGALAGALRARARSEYAKFLKEASEDATDAGQSKSGVAIAAPVAGKEDRNDLPDTVSQRVPERMLLNGRYEVLETLGRGAMGIVHLGRDTQLGKDVAIKFLHEDRAKDPKEVQRFKREVLILRDIRHPNVFLGSQTIL
jgi:hypothetical protein